jgi:glycosyltransferase involved in cell wall biosynthesis
LSEQTLKITDFEVLVVSDGHDEQTKMALMDWKINHCLNLQFLHTPDKKGPAAARNYGWLNAKSPLIAFTDDDCLPEKNWLSAYIQAYQHPLDIAFTGYTHVPLPLAPTDYALNTAGLERADFITANCACSKTALVKIGGFDERFKMAWREDSDLEFKLLNLNIPIIKIGEAKITHPVRSAPWGVSIKEQKKGIYDALLFKKFPKLYRTKIQPQPLWNYYLINFLLLLLITALLQQNKILATCSVLIAAALYCNFAYKRLKNSSKTVSHILEMLYTSLLIPTISVYWRVYGSIKYKVFFF